MYHHLRENKNLFWLRFFFLSHINTSVRRHLIWLKTKMCLNATQNWRRAYGKTVHQDGKSFAHNDVVENKLVRYCIANCKSIEKKKKIDDMKTVFVRNIVTIYIKEVCYGLMK